MQAVVQKVNRAGGICGRILELRLVDDGWRADLGQSYIQNFIKEGYFALAVVPSSEGLTAAITAGDIAKARIPVVGTDGMLIQQYRSPWVWPVATATVSTMRVMAKHGYARGARSFAIVYDRFYKFGKEGADAFRRSVERLSGAKVKAFVGIQPGQASYSAEIQQFNGACRSGCDFVALLLEPATAETWIAGRPAFGTKITSGAQTLFNERFAKNCGAPCEGMLVWTGYNPPIGTLASLGGVRRYVNDVRSISPTADETNQFLQGAYLGMSVLVEALQRVGPELTRTRLQQALNALTYSSDLSSALTWRTERRFANQRAQAFSIVVANGSFAGFRNEQTGFIRDPEL
jgi:ABC-type branched-subunit amino acid transport system substrate-binding protein